MSEEEMKKYCEKIKNDDSIDLDWLIAGKRAEVNKDKVFYNLFLTFYLSFFIRSLTGIVIRDIHSVGVNIIISLLACFAAIGGGLYGYKHALAQNIAELEVLEYIRKQPVAKERSILRLGMGSLLL
ncbi:hypothetical protein [Enterococcus faecium]|uniref:hypothetical protein n=1 Tax=Enterococcus TaxID=1350 RepID=UPI0019135B29|nr:hypothetical protein [Enterococcus faecium]MBK5028392.1 hypothetical protein [Enterococcus faecium]MBK5039032.1 hypothetical protein [Enterococcus faecium]MBK5044106.1 hypothetical protein [Enterococcus faecium]MBK5068909.1 hypothetical protein [Enterococcus faecium]MBK5132282.1 hypothetical protein [Enterococcus faecium]